jgi:serine/threonine protein kinase
MTPERWRKIGSLFERAVQLDPRDRLAYLDSVSEDPLLRDEVLRLIRHHEMSGGFLDQPLSLGQSPPAGWVGRTLAHFRILEPLGWGGQAQVYLAEDLKLHRQVALKLLLETKADNAVARRRFLKEARTAARLDHPFVCSIFEVGEEQGTCFIAMELVQGETLRQRLSRGQPPMAEALKWGLEIAEALDEAHRQGLVHRDLKPSNLMVTQSGHIKVMDFGLAKRVLLTENVTDHSLAESLTDRGTAVGTLAYMSPEQMWGKPLDARADLFAFGLVLFELLTGIHPFGRASSVETASAILHDSPRSLSELLADCPPLLARTLEELLARDPKRRPASARTVAESLSELLQSPAGSSADESSKLSRSPGIALTGQDRIVLARGRAIPAPPSDEASSPLTQGKDASDSAGLGSRHQLPVSAKWVIAALATLFLAALLAYCQSL